MSEIKLNPCPFCGGKARFLFEDSTWVYCEECGCEGGYYDTQEDAIEAWNIRADVPDTDVGEIMAKAIDEFVAEALKYFTEYDLKHGYPTVADCKIILHDVAEQMKGRCE